MQVMLFKNFAKRKDSTKRPNISAPDKTVNVELKRDTSYISPAFTISDSDYPIYKYAYIPALDRYYFIASTKQGNRNFYEISLDHDDLATAKDAIANYICFVERCADSRYYNEDIPDNALSVEDAIEYSASAVTPIFSSTSGCYVARIVGRDTSGVATYVFATLGEIGQIFNPVYDTYFQSGSWAGLTIGDFIQAFLCDPSKYLVGAYYSPIGSGDYSAYGTSELVNVGFYPTNVAGFRITSPQYTIGPIALNKPASIYSDFRKSDAAFSSYTLYLPGVGSVGLSADDMDQALTLSGAIDLLTGDIFYKLSGTGGGLVATYNGNIYASLQLSKGDASGGAGFISNAVATVGAIASGSGAGVVAGAIETAKSAITPTPSINGSQTGAAALRHDPDVVISVLQKHSAEFPTAQYGRPCCKNLRLGDLSGYIKCGAPSLEMAVESDILDRINAKLAEGFYYE